jgi:hypothetical protein
MSSGILLQLVIYTNDINLMDENITTVKGNRETIMEDAIILKQLSPATF